MIALYQLSADSKSQQCQDFRACNFEDEITLTLYLERGIRDHNELFQDKRR